MNVPIFLNSVEPTISIAEIVAEVPIPDSPGRLFVVPVGNLDLDYIAKVDDLRPAMITQTGEDLWTPFFNTISQQLQPDMILIDSRTGINEWSAFSFLRAADRAIVFLHPNAQNTQGIDLLLKALASKVPVQLVLSPIPFQDLGQQKIKEHWASLQSAHINSLPIAIQYSTELAIAPDFPVSSLVSHYMNIANVIAQDPSATAHGTSG